MGTQGIALPVPPATLLARCAGEPLVCALDGGGERSWGCGEALIGMRPCATLRIGRDGVAAVWINGAAESWRGDPLSLIERFRIASGIAGDADAPTSGGIVVALSYDVRHWIERLPQRQADESGLPMIYAVAYDWLLSYSYRTQRYELVSSCQTRLLAG